MAEYPYVDGMEPADFDYLRKLRTRVSENESFDDSAYVLQALDMILNPARDDARLIYLSRACTESPTRFWLLAATPSATGSCHVAAASSMARSM